MKHKIFILSIFISNILFAATNITVEKEPITLSNVDRKLKTLSLKADTKEYLTNFTNKCIAKDWAGCHISWYDLHLNGLRYITITDNGFNFSSWQFPNNDDATDIYTFVINGLDHVANKAYWDLGIEPVRPYKDILSYVPVRYARFDNATKQAALDIIQANLGTYDIQLNVNTEFKTPRAEWLRLLALTFMVRKDQLNTNKVLDELKKYGKMTENAQLYNDLLLATKLYFKKTGDLK